MADLWVPVGRFTDSTTEGFASMAPCVSQSFSSLSSAGVAYISRADMLGFGTSTIYMVVGFTTGASGNVVLRTRWYSLPIGTAYSGSPPGTPTDLQVTGVSPAIASRVTAFSLGTIDVSASEFWAVEANRLGSDGADTLGANTSFLGMLVSG